MDPRWDPKRSVVCSLSATNGIDPSAMAESPRVIFVVIAELLDSSELCSIIKERGDQGAPGERKWDRA